VAWAPAAKASLFVDTFDNVNDSGMYSDCGLNDELSTRQSGSEAPAGYVAGAGFAQDTWTCQVNHSAHAGKLWGLPTSSAGASWVCLDKNFQANARIQVTVDPLLGDTSSDAWVSVGFRGASNTPDNNFYNVLATNVGGSLLMRSSGAWVYFENGASILSGSVADNATYALDILTSGDQLTISINGLLIDLNGSADGIARTMSGAAATQTNNYISLGFVTTGDYTGSEMDDLIISVPEPATMGLLAAGGLVGLLRRG
jgi:hypothetical protein